MRKKPEKIIQKTPKDWAYVNRTQSEKLAEKVQKKLEGKKLVKVDNNTWVYVNPGEEPKPINKTNYLDRWSRNT